MCTSHQILFVYLFILPTPSFNKRNNEETHQFSYKICMCKSNEVRENKKKILYIRHNV